MTTISVTWQGRKEVVKIDHMRATAKNPDFQRELNRAVAVMSGHPIVKVENWMAEQLLRAFGGGEIIKQPKQDGLLTGDVIGT